MTFEFPGAAAIVLRVPVGCPATVGAAQFEGGPAVPVVTSGDIGFQVLAPSVVAQTRHVPKYSVVEVLGSITKGGMKLPRSVGSIPELARNPLPRMPSPLNVVRMMGNGGLFGMYSHSPKLVLGMLKSIAVNPPSQPICALFHISGMPLDP